MTLIVETGSGLANADSYCSLDDAASWHTSMGNVAWAALASDTVREQALRRATAYMRQVYRSRWGGYRYTATQSLDWPRSFVYLEPFVHGAVGTYPYLVASDIVPVDVVNACAELALRASTGALLEDLGPQKIKTKIGPLETEYNPITPQIKRYPAVDAMLAPYFAGKNGDSLRVVRA